MLGTFHAWEAVRRGWRVVHLDADVEPRSASVRNFGLLWVSGRAPGAELDLALDARSRWDDVARSVPGVGLRAEGSLTVVDTPAEVAVLEELCARPDAAARGVELWEPDRVVREHPGVRGRCLAALRCTLDAVVEPRSMLGALRAHLARADGYRWLPGRTAVDLDAGRVVDHTGARHAGDAIVLCPGVRGDGPVAWFLAGAPLRRVRLLMLETAPLGERLGTALADAGSLRYYPAFAGPARDALPPADPLVARHELQLLVAQRADGCLTVGDTHERHEPLPFAQDEEAAGWLLVRLAAVLGRPVPPVVRRWSGTYGPRSDAGIVHRAMVLPGVVVVTGAGGRGVTLAPAIAAETFDEML